MSTEGVDKNTPQEETTKMSNEITCVNKTNRYDPHERITHVGRKSEVGCFYITQQEAISYIDQGYRFFVRAGGRIVNVVVARSQYGNKYIKTEADGVQPNNLLSLSECKI